MFITMIAEVNVVTKVSEGFSRLHGLDTCTGQVLPIVDLAVAVTTGVKSGIFQEVAGRVFSQAYEAEADYARLYLVARTGYDVTESPKFWRRMAVEHPGSIKGGFLATHPSTPERFLAIEQTTREIEEKRRQSLPLIPERQP